MGNTASQAPATRKLPLKRTGRVIIRHIDIQLSPRHAQAWRDLNDGLYASKAALKDGTHIESPSSALRWLLENLENMSIQIDGK